MRTVLAAIAVVLSFAVVSEAETTTRQLLVGATVQPRIKASFTPTISTVTIRQTDRQRGYVLLSNVGQLHMKTNLRGQVQLRVSSPQLTVSAKLLNQPGLDHAATVNLESEAPGDSVAAAVGVKISVDAQQRLGDYQLQLHFDPVLN